jgi:hypothetical protein
MAASSEPVSIKLPPKPKHRFLNTFHALRRWSGWWMVILVSLGGCALGSSVTSEYCLIANPITFSESDTVETRLQIHRHNAKWVCVCEDECE